MSFEQRHLVGGLGCPCGGHPRPNPTYAMLSRYVDKCTQQRVLMHRHREYQLHTAGRGPLSAWKALTETFSGLCYSLNFCLMPFLPFPPSLLSFPSLLPCSPFFLSFLLFSSTSPSLQTFLLKQITVHMILPSKRTQRNKSGTKLSDGTWELSHSFPGDPEDIISNDMRAQR